MSLPLLLTQHMHRVFAEDRRGQFHRRTLNGVEEVLKKRYVHVVVVHVPKQRIDCQKRLGNDHYNTHCKSVVGRLGNPYQGPQAQLGKPISGDQQSVLGSLNKPIGEIIAHKEVTHNFFHKLTNTLRDTIHAPSYDFWRLDNKPSRKGARQYLRTSYQSTPSRPSPSGPNATRGRRAGRSTAAATTRGSSSPGQGKSSSACRNSAARPSGRLSSSATAGARPRSRRPSSRCTWRASQPGGSRTSPSSPGGRRCPP